jgi:hypothetical protein
MSKNQAANWRRARSVCIVTDLPVRLQAKSATRKDKPVETQIVRMGSVRVRVSLFSTGEFLVEMEPP